MKDSVYERKERTFIAFSTYLDSLQIGGTNFRHEVLHEMLDKLLRETQFQMQSASGAHLSILRSQQQYLLGLKQLFHKHSSYPELRKAPSLRTALFDALQEEKRVVSKPRYGIS